MLNLFNLPYFKAWLSGMLAPPHSQTSASLSPLIPKLAFIETFQNTRCKIRVPQTSGVWEFHCNLLFVLIILRAKFKFLVWPPAEIREYFLKVICIKPFYVLLFFMRKIVEIEFNQAPGISLIMSFKNWFSSNGRKYSILSFVWETSLGIVFWC